MHSFILFPSTSPRHHALSLCVCEMSPSFTFTPTWNNIRFFFKNLFCPSPFPASLPQRCYISKPLSSCALVHIKTSMWAKCHRWVGKFSWPNWNALSGDRWWGGQKRIKRREEAFHLELELKIISEHVTTVQKTVARQILLESLMWSLSLQKRARGQYLFFKVCEHLNLMEKDYFGLTYKDSHEQKVRIHARTKDALLFTSKNCSQVCAVMLLEFNFPSVLCLQCWLDPTKEIKKQICSKFQIILISQKCHFLPESYKLNINVELIK